MTSIRCQVYTLCFLDFIASFCLFEYENWLCCLIMPASDLYAHTIVNLRKPCIFILCAVSQVSMKAPQDHLYHCMFYFQSWTQPWGSTLAFPDKIREQVNVSFLRGCWSHCCIQHILEHYLWTNTASKIMTKTLQNRAIEIAPEKWGVEYKVGGGFQRKPCLGGGTTHFQKS